MDVIVEACTHCCQRTKAEQPPHDFFDTVQIIFLREDVYKGIPQARQRSLCRSKSLRVQL